MVILMKKNPIWENNIKNIYSNKIIDNYVDILIIGGGIAGITTAYYLRNSKKKILLIDKDNIGYDTTYKSTAKISFIQKDIYQKLEKTYNLETSKLYFESQKEAINNLVNIINNEKISCDLEKIDSYLFATKKESLSKLSHEKKILESFGVECFNSEKLPIKYNIESSFYVKDNYTFNPKKYIDELAKVIYKKINIVINTTAYNIEKHDKLYRVFTDKGGITSKIVIVATHYPFFIIPNFIPIRNYISREYINAGVYKPNKKFTAINIDKDTESIRFYNDYIIYVSNNHRLTNKTNYELNYKEAQDKFRKNFNSEINYSWINQDLMTNDYLPIIGCSNSNDKSLLIATGFNAWGMTNGVIAAKLLTDIINDNYNKYYNLFKPSRMNKVGIVNSLIDGVFYSKAYIQTFFNRKHVCPHMMCGLIFNKEEKTWDCPCHGSRFSIDGKLITGPSSINISVDKA